MGARAQLGARQRRSGLIKHPNHQDPLRRQPELLIHSLTGRQGEEGGGSGAARQ